MGLCTVKCPICGSWMSRTLSRKGKPYLFCGKCRSGMLLMKGETIKSLDVVCKDIPESQLPSETLKKYRSG